MNKYNFDIQTKMLRRTLPGMITDILREAILSGELSGGTQLKQEELANQFQVSLSALREALKTLEAEGLVNIYPNRGAVVSALSAAEAQEIFDIRLFLELGALELAIPNLTAADLSGAEEILGRLDQESDSSKWGRLNGLFHEALYLPADRPRLITMIRAMHNNIERYLRLFLATMNFQERSQAEHWQLLEACRTRDVAAAKGILRKHMADASAILTQHLGSARG